jgi:hypothetical protein
MSRLIPLVLLLAILCYLGGYAVARAGGWVAHTSNHRHWIPEKRSPEHHVVACVGFGNDSLDFFFKPLRALEERYHEAVNPR